RPRSVRPGPETPAPERFLRRPDLLERRPAVGRSLVPEEPAAVRPLEAQVHLEPAVVRPAAVRPGGLVAVDAEKRVQMRRMPRLAVLARRPPLPEPDGRFHGRDAHPGEDATRSRRLRPAHDLLPTPGRALVGVDLVSEPGDRRLPLRLRPRGGA